MPEDDRRSLEARTAFEELWRRGDPWELETSEAARISYRRQLELLSDRRYARALEIGCGAGAFTRLLAGLADTVLAVDVAEPAIERARRAGLDPDRVEFRTANAMELDIPREGPFDLVVMSESIYCIGWLYPLFELGWLASQLRAAVGPGGRLLMANTYGKDTDHLLSPWLIDTYRDLFRNVGWRLEHDEVFDIRPHGIDYEVLLTLYANPDEPDANER